VLIFRSGPQSRENVVAQKLFTQVFYNHLGRAGLMRLLNYTINVLALADIGDHGNHLAMIVFLEPRNDDGGVQSSGIS
jgi:hypothetical protein